MRTKIVLAILLSVTLITGAFAQGFNNSFEGNNQQRQRRGIEGGFDIEKILEKIKEIFPDKYDELIKFKKENPELFRKELKKIMQAFRGGRKKRGRDGSSSSFSENNNRQNHRGKMRNNSQGRMSKGGNREKMMKRVTKYLDDLKEKDPKEYQRLIDLKESDPNTFRKELRKKAKKMVKEKMKRKREDMKKVHALIKKYRKSNNDQEKIEIKNELKQKLSVTFKEMLDKQRSKVKELKNKVKELEKRVQQREENSEEMIENKLNTYLISPNLRW